MASVWLLLLIGCGADRPQLADGAANSLDGRSPDGAGPGADQSVLGPDQSVLVADQSVLGADSGATAADALGGSDIGVDAGQQSVKRPSLGVQRWDMYSGKGATQQQELGYLPGKQGFLKPAQWHHRAPFFCRRTKDVKQIKHPSNAGPIWFNYPYSKPRLQQVMDQEMIYADAAKIDYFIFNGPTRTLYSNGWELHNNLDAYLASKTNAKVEFVFALYGHQAINYGKTKVDLMLNEIIGYMKHPKWHKVKGNRPLVPVLWPSKFKTMLQGQSSPAEKMTLGGFVKRVRSRAKASGLADPYIVGQELVHTYKQASTLKSAGFDAMADYAPAYGGGTQLRDQAPLYATASKSLIAYYNKYNLGAMKFVPSMTLQYYPWPRAKSNKTHHYRLPNKGEIAARMKMVLDYTVAHQSDCDAQTVFMYSWNEHSEGGGLCPTMGSSPKYAPVRWKLDEVGAALSSYQAPPP